MKFSIKLVLSTMIVLALALGFSGFYFVNNVFETSLDREVGQALDESSILSFAFETAALNVPLKYSVMPDSVVEEIASKLEMGGQGGGRLLRIADEEKNILYTSSGFTADEGLLPQTDRHTKSYRVIRGLDGFYVHTCVSVNALNRILYLETMKDVTEVFTERAQGFSLYRKVTVAMLLTGMVIMLLIASLLTKPIRLLTRATREMAAGDYTYRARQISRDELGQLTGDFNKMANALEENISKLEEEIEAREEFMGAFAHELKTPLTAIIGYADMLRSHKLDEEKSIMSANYIYTEGRRLEAMSFRLLDIIVAKQGEARLQETPAGELFAYLREMFAEKKDRDIRFSHEEAVVWMEPNLIKTVLVNLIDNACKASENTAVSEAGSTAAGKQDRATSDHAGVEAETDRAGAGGSGRVTEGGRAGVVEVTGQTVDGGYRIAVKDYGIGIPEAEQNKIVKAFYMVDKSRARSKNGAGLGLALCAEILKIHHSELQIESKVGEGSCFSFILAPCGCKD